MKKRILLLPLLIPMFLLAQNTIKEADTDAEDQFQYNENDSVNIDDLYEDGLSSVELGTAEIYTLKFNNDLEKRYYAWLRKRVRDVWPFVLETQHQYYSISDSIELIKKKRDKRKFTKQRKKELAEDFEERLKDLSRSRGQVLTKLIHRETDKTVHDILKELRGGFSAFIWKTAGKAFEIDTKATFDPRKTREDLYIEVILRKEFASGRLQRYEDIDWTTYKPKFKDSKVVQNQKKAFKKKLSK